MSPRQPQSVHQLKVTLLETTPPIWRRLQVASTINLRRLHDVIQATMGWMQSHLYEFRVDGVEYGEPSSEYDLPSARRAKSTQLRQVTPEPGTTLHYLYDFGDGWKHEVLVEAVLLPEPRVSYPRCIGGERACPPEDVGGIGGYEEFLTVIGNPRHREYQDLMAWSGGHFDPEAFDLAAINAALAHLGPSPWERSPWG